MSLVLHTATANQIQKLVQNPSHAVLLTAPAGSGKMTVAQQIVVDILSIDIEDVGSQPYIRIIAPQDNKAISIETVRELQKFLQLKTTGKAELRRAVIISQAELLTTEAQNALLKVLEEPPADTVLILTASSIQSLLPTIRSRLRVLGLNRPSKTDLLQYFTEAGHSSENINKAYFLSGGLPGLMQALLREDTDHPLVASVSQAKQLLSQPVLERLAAVDKLSKQKDDAYNTVDALQRIAQVALSQAASRGNSSIVQWHRVQKQAFEAKEAMQKNANTKLVLTKLLLHV